MYLIQCLLPGKTRAQMGCPYRNQQFSRGLSLVDSMVVNIGKWLQKKVNLTELLTHSATGSHFEG